MFSFIIPTANSSSWKIRESRVLIFFFFFFFLIITTIIILRMGTQNGHNVLFLKSASLKERKRKAMKRIKQIYKISNRGKKKKKKIMPSDP